MAEKLTPDESLKRLATVFDTPDKLDALERWTQRELFRPKRIIVGMSGASGQQWGIRLLEVLQNIPYPGVEIHLVMSDGAKEVMKHEMGYNPEDIERVCKLASVVYDNRNMAAAISSGSFVATCDGMIVVPCSVKTLQEIASSNDESLISRAAFRIIGEKKRLLLVPREPTVSRAYLTNALEAMNNEAIVVFPEPSFYNGPMTVKDIIDQTVQRILDKFGIEANLFKRWETPQGS